MDYLKRLPLHPYLFTAYSVLALVAYNIGKFVPWMAVRSLVFFLLIVAAAYWPLKRLTRSPYKAALLLTLSLAVFFSYGRVYDLLGGLRLLGIYFGRHRTLVLIALLLLAAGIIWIVRTRRDLQGITQALNVVLLIALCFPIFQIARYEIQSLAQDRRAVGAGEAASASSIPNLVLPAGENPPDIYYIILDTYTRQDSLQKYLNFDNSGFVNRLKEMGFYVAPCSQSNYANTELSLASSLNLNYLDVLGDNSKQIYTPPELYRLLQDNAARLMLEKAGYRVVAFDSGYSPTEWKDADEYLARTNEPFTTYVLGGINPFEALELQTSAGLLLYDAKSLLPQRLRTFLDAAYTEHRDRILYAFDKLETVPQMPGPKFVFVHILAPHSPFVFGVNGETVGRKTPFTLNHDLEIADPKDYSVGYRNQLQYVNRRSLHVLQEIIAKSKTPPVIILQGDHGTRANVSSEIGRMEILNAYYLPGSGSGPYATISPVNTFRIIFNQYLGGQFETLPDVSFYSTVQKPDVFTVFQSDSASCNP
jgi:hypothetical protein